MICLPLFITGAASLQEANDICELRRRVDPVDSYADYTVLPRHIWVSLSLLCSLGCELYWLFHSPHLTSPSAEGRELDRKLGSFFAVQLLAGILIAASACYSCTRFGSKAGTILGFFCNLSAFGLSVLASNLLEHRYLLVKARIVCKIIHSEGEGILHLLSRAFSWEILCLVALGVSLVLFELDLKDVLVPVGIFSVAAIMICDTMFSILATSIFIKPLLGAARNASESQVRVWVFYWRGVVSVRGGI
jgi:hypothetical protein